MLYGKAKTKTNEHKKKKKEILATTSVLTSKVICLCSRYIVSAYINIKPTGIFACSYGKILDPSQFCIKI